MVFAAVFYPLRLFVPVGAIDMIAFVIVGDVYGRSRARPTWRSSPRCLAMSAVLCAWQAQNHDRHRERLTHMSRTDPLTGCLNRRGFEERVTNGARAAASRRSAPSRVVLLDLDNFKAVNDMNGHAAGDELLCWVVEALQPRGAPDGLGRATGRRRVRDPRSGRRRERRGAHRHPRAQAAVRAGRRLDRHRDASPPTESTRRSFSATPTASSTRTSTATRPAFHRRPPRADLGGHACARRGRAHGDARSSTRRSSPATRPGIAQQLGWSGADLAHLRIAAMLHDIGKVVLPDRILQKPESLDEREYEEVKRHPGDGRRADQPRRGHGADRRLGAPLARALRRHRLSRRAGRRRRSRSPRASCWWRTPSTR